MLRSRARDFRAAAAASWALARSRLTAASFSAASTSAAWRSLFSRVRSSRTRSALPRQALFFQRLLRDKLGRICVAVSSALSSAGPVPLRCRNSCGPGSSFGTSRGEIPRRNAGSRSRTASSRYSQADLPAPALCFSYIWHMSIGRIMGPINGDVERRPRTGNDRETENSIADPPPKINDGRPSFHRIMQECFLSDASRRTSSGCRPGNEESA